MNLSLQEVDALITALELMSIRDQNNQEGHLNVSYSEIQQKLKDYRLQLTV
jgi:hypothetical protein